MPHLTRMSNKHECIRMMMYLLAGELNLRGTERVDGIDLMEAHASGLLTWEEVQPHIKFIINVIKYELNQDQEFRMVESIMHLFNDVQLTDPQSGLQMIMDEDNLEMRIEIVEKLKVFFLQEKGLYVV
nr:uncharacterized protein LOC111509584 [Leptinotarsa decemlineata]